MSEVKDISRQPLIEWSGQIVITTAQLAEAYGATPDNINKNFSSNKDRFTEGKHYILLTGEELRQFKNHPNFSKVVQKNTSQLYLWTRRGASRHCKILGTDKAWEQFDYLEEYYFDRKLQAKNDIRSQIKAIAQGTEELYQRVESAESRILNLEDNMTLDYGQQSVLGQVVSKTVISVLGGKDSNAYHQMGRKVFAECNHDLKVYFKVNARANVPRKRYKEAVQYAENWKPCTNTIMMITDANAQETLRM